MATGISFTRDPDLSALTTTLNQVAGIINVQDPPYLARGDGAADDTAAIQAAVNAGPAVWFPEGTYKLTTAVTIPAGRKLFGTTANISGSGATINQASAGEYSFVIVGTALAYNQYNELRDLKITGGLGVRTALTENLVVRGCVFASSAYGLYMSVNAGEEDVKPRIYDNLFASISITGLHQGDSRLADAWVINNTFKDCSLWAIRMGYLDGGFVCNNAVFSELAAGTENNGFSIQKPIWSRISDNNIFQVNGWGLYLLSPRFSAVERNTCVWTGQSTKRAAFYVRQYGAGVASEAVEYRGNIARQVYGHGFDIAPANLGDACYRWNIEGNHVLEAGYTAGSKILDGLVLNGLTDFSFKDNHVDGNSQTRYWLTLQSCVNGKIAGNTSANCVNADPFFNAGNTGLAFSDAVCTAINSSRAVRASECGLIRSDATGGAVTLTLPEAALVSPGTRVTVVKIDASANNVIIQRAGADTINGGTVVVPNLTTQWGKVSLRADGVSSWIVEA